MKKPPRPRTQSRLAQRLRSLGAIETVVGVIVAGAVAIGVTGIPNLHTTHQPARVAAVQPATDVRVSTHAYPVDHADPRQNFGELFLPRRSDPTPVVVFIHGGGWKSRIGYASSNPLAKRLAHSGVAVWNLEYRRVGSGGGWPQTFIDVAAGVDYLSTLQTTYRQLDLKNVVVVGHSAGGQLAAWTASRSMLTPGDIGANPIVVPKEVFSLAGVLDMAAAAYSGNNRVVSVLGGQPWQVGQRYLNVSPIEHLNRRIPMHIYQGLRDTIVPVSQVASFTERARAAGVPITCTLMPKATHPSLVNVTSPDWRTIEDAILTATKTHTASVQAIPSPTPPA